MRRAFLLLGILAALAYAGVIVQKESKVAMFEVCFGSFSRVRAFGG